MSSDLTNKNAKAIAKYIRMSPNKVRRVLNQIRGRSYKDALMILEFIPYSACKPVLQVLQSAASNAQNNKGMIKSELLISTAYADPGPILKRFRPRSQGRGFKIKKPMCHITISVSQME
jgi:large subunit ribosomal protein L22